MIIKKKKKKKHKSESDILSFFVSGHCFESN